MDNRSDPMSHARVHRALSESPDLDPLAVSVDTHDGRLRLSGEVGSFAEKLAALEAVGAEVEIGGIDNGLTVRPYDVRSDLTDQAIAEGVGHALLQLHVPGGVSFAVDQHVVTLTGTVSTFSLRTAIRHAVESVVGVNLIENQIGVEASADPVRVLTDDESWSLLRSAPYGRLAVSVRGEVDVFPINFVVSVDQQVFFRTAPGSKLLALTINDQVALEVDVFNGEEAWSVVLKGAATRVEMQADIDAAETLPLRPLVPTLKFRWVRIQPTSISGREFQTAPEPERN